MTQSSRFIQNHLKITKILKYTNPINDFVNLSVKSVQNSKLIIFLHDIYYYTYINTNEGWTLRSKHLKFSFCLRSLFHIQKDTAYKVSHTHSNKIRNNSELNKKKRKRSSFRN